MNPIVRFGEVRICTDLPPCGVHAMVGALKLHVATNQVTSSRIFYVETSLELDDGRMGVL
jgi:hypothetical protein